MYIRMEHGQWVDGSAFTKGLSYCYRYDTLNMVLPNDTGLQTILDLMLSGF